MLAEFSFGDITEKPDFTVVLQKIIRPDVYCITFARGVFPC